VGNTVGGKDQYAKKALKTDRGQNPFVNRKVLKRTRETPSSKKERKKKSGREQGGPTNNGFQVLLRSVRGPK